jgi:hypothetical protein
MPTNPCELIEEYVATLADVGPDGYTVSLVSSFDAESGPYAVVDGDVTESFNAESGPTTNIVGYNVTESFGVSDSANSAQSLTELVSESVAALSAMVSYPSISVTDTADASSAQGVVSITALKTSTANVTSAAAFTVHVLRSIAEAAVVSSVPVATNTVAGEDIVETVDGSEATRAVIDANIVESVVSAATALPIHKWIENATSSGSAAEATTQHVVGTLSIASSAAVSSAPFFPRTGGAFWANTEKLASATWDQVPFDSYIMHQGQLLAAGDAGLYKFGGDTDAGTQINAKVRSDLTDFDSAMKKCFEVATVGATSSAPFRITVTTEMGSFVYQTRKPSAMFPTNHLAPIGRGLVGRYVRMEIDNQVAGFEGSDFSVNDVSIRVGETTRKG